MPGQAKLQGAQGAVRGGRLHEMNPVAPAQTQYCLSMDAKLLRPLLSHGALSSIQRKMFSSTAQAVAPGWRWFAFQRIIEEGGDNIIVLGKISQMFLTFLTQLPVITKYDYQATRMDQPRHSRQGIVQPSW